MILVTSHESPLSLRKHLANCLVRTLAVDPETSLESLAHNADEQSALSKFIDSIRQVWEETFGDAPSAFNLRSFVNLVRVISLDVEAGHDDERQAISTFRLSFFSTETRLRLGRDSFSSALRERPTEEARRLRRFNNLSKMQVSR
jgi:hypothetical protein